jgi:hypothetical protein
MDKIICINQRSNCGEREDLAHRLEVQPGLAEANRKNINTPYQI